MLHATCCGKDRSVMSTIYPYIALSDIFRSGDLVITSKNKLLKLSWLLVSIVETFVT